MAFQLVSGWLLPLSGLFGGCCSNVYALEALVRSSTVSTVFITFSQFLFIALISFVVLFGKTFKIKLKAPLRAWITVVVLFFSSSVINNYALEFNISIPVHIIFKSLSLLANIFVGYVFFKKTVTVPMFSSVMFVTFGVIVSTMASKPNSSEKGGSDGEVAFWQWLFGVGLLTLTLMISSVLGHFQEHVYRKYNATWDESLFCCHTLSLPFFLPFVNMGDFMVVETSPFLTNIITQYICIAAVQKLSSKVTSLTLNFLLTMRKLISLIISVSVFGSGGGSEFWLGVFMVMSGTLAYFYFSSKR
jgi:UDP-xylose/UDP-N-acetylglucosamine transporter B4